MLDLKLAPSMLSYAVAIPLLGGVAWELVGRTSVQTEDKETWAGCTISIVTRHQVDFLIVHDDGTRAQTSTWKPINRKPMVGYRIESLTASRPLGFARLASHSQDKPIVDQSQGDLKTRCLHLVFLHSVEELINLQATADRLLFTATRLPVPSDYVDLTVTGLDR